MWHAAEAVPELTAKNATAVKNLTLISFISFTCFISNHARPYMLVATNRAMCVRSIRAPTRLPRQSGLRPLAVAKAVGLAHYRELSLKLRAYRRTHAIGGEPSVHNRRRGRLRLSRLV